MLSEGVKKGLEAYIIREDGTRFPEHQIVHSDGHDGDESSTTSCFLESTEGSLFTVVIKVQSAFAHHPQYDWGIDVHIDGRQLDKYVRRRGDPNGLKVSTMVSVEDGKLVRGKMTFAKLRTTDSDADVTLQGSQLRSVGQISVSFKRGIMGKDAGRPSRPSVVQSDVGIASEKGKKLGGAVSSTCHVPYKAVNTYYFDLHDTEKPFHRIVFNYRTAPVLELMGIIKAPEPIVPVVHAGPSTKRKRNATSEDTKPDQKAVLAARVKDLERKLREVAPLPRARFPAQVIDLTGEDSDEE